MHLEAIVARQSISHHHYHSVWQREVSGRYAEIKGKQRWTERRGGGGVRAFRDNSDGLSNREYIDIISLYKIHSQSVPAHGPTHSCRAFIDPCKLSCSLQLGTPPCSLTICLYALRQNRSL